MTGSTDEFVSVYDLNSGKEGQRSPFFKVNIAVGIRERWLRMYFFRSRILSAMQGCHWPCLG
jgi:hypothetical protein